MANKYKIALKVLLEYIANDDIKDLLPYYDYLKDAIKEKRLMKFEKVAKVELGEINKIVLQNFYDLVASGNKTNKISEGRKNTILYKLKMMGIEDRYLNYAVKQATDKKIINMKWIKKVSRDAKLKNRIIDEDIHYDSQSNETLNKLREQL